MSTTDARVAIKQHDLACHVVRVALEGAALLASRPRPSLTLGPRPACKVVQEMQTWAADYMENL